LTRLVDPPPIALESFEPAPESKANDPASGPAQSANFVWLALHQVLLRIGWIFKTESIVMPAFLDFIGGGPVLRGCLPVLQRLGFSVPPVLYARRLKLLPMKKWSVVTTTIAMAAPFALLSALFFTGVWRDASGQAAWWLAPLFLVVYALFFCLTGMNQLGANALQGKLVRAEVRGRLFMVAVLVGSPVAIGAAWWLLPAWLGMADGGFGWIFAAVAALFVLAGLSIAPAVETPDNFTEESTKLWQKFRNAASVISKNPDARAAGWLAALVSVNFMLFPHYQAIGRERFGLTLGAMTLWVCIQNLATAAISLVAGPMADRLGNRAAMQFSVIGLCLAPLSVLVCLAAPADVGQRWYWLVFAPIGFTPVTVRLLINYTLEISAVEDHSHFVSAIGMCLALPVIVGSPLVGLSLGVVGSGPVFAAGLVLLLLAAAQTFRLSEPRHAAPRRHRD